MDPSTRRPHIVYPDSDIILRTQDGVELHVHKQVLREASQTFRSMLSIPAVNESPPQPIDIEEGIIIFLPVLQHLYGFELSIQRFDSYHDVLPILEVARKYNIDAAEIALMNHLGIQLSKEPNPLRAWAIANRYKLESAMTSAAQRYYEAWDDQNNKLEDIPELDLVSGRQLAGLMAERRRVLDSIRHSAAKYLFPPMACEECSYIEDYGEPVEATDSSGKTFYASTTRSVWLDLVGEQIPFGWAEHPTFLRRCIETSTCNECKKRLEWIDRREYNPDNLLAVVRQIVPELRRQGL